MGIASMTRLGGNSDKPILINNWPEDKTLEKKLMDMMEEASKTFKALEKMRNIDFSIFENNILIGIEPSYMYDEIYVISINRDKNSSMLRSGISFGNYGSNIISKVSFYKDKKTKSKFIRFVDKYHALIYGENNGK
jgi:hypothetical protein